MSFRFHLALALLLILMAGLLTGGCGHVPITSLYKLSSFDVAHADPAVIRAAARAPAALAPRPQGARLTVTHRVPGGSQDVAEVFILEEVREAAELRQVERFRREGYPLTVYRLSEADVRRVKALQGTLLADRAAGRGGHGSLGVAVDACARGVLPPGALLSSTYLKLDAETGYLPVLEDVDLRKEISPEAFARAVPPCAAAG